MFATRFLVVALAALIGGACGGGPSGDDSGDDSSTADAAGSHLQERANELCTAMASCSAVGSSQVALCTDTVVAHVTVTDEDRLTACAACTSSVTCQALRDGTCNDECVSIEALLEPPDGTVSTHQGGNSCSKTWANTRAHWVSDGGVYIDVRWCNIDSYYEPRLTAPGVSVDCSRILETCTDNAGATGQMSAVQRGADVWLEGTCTCGSYAVTLSVPTWFDLPLYVSP